MEYTELEMTLPPLGEDFCACATDGDKLMETLEDLAILVRTGRRKKQQQVREFLSNRCAGGTDTT